MPDVVSRTEGLGRFIATNALAFGATNAITNLAGFEIRGVAPWYSMVDANGFNVWLSPENYDPLAAAIQDALGKAGGGITNRAVLYFAADVGAGIYLGRQAGKYRTLTNGHTFLGVIKKGSRPQFK